MNATGPARPAAVTHPASPLPGSTTDTDPAADGGTSGPHTPTASPGSRTTPAR